MEAQELVYLEADQVRTALDGMDPALTPVHRGLCIKLLEKVREECGYSPLFPHMAKSQAGSPQKRKAKTSAVMEQGVDATREVSGLKAVSCELVNEIMYDCLQFHGGLGYMQEATIERMARDARILPIGGGATEVMLEEISKRSYR